MRKQENKLILFLHLQLDLNGNQMAEVYCEDKPSNVIVGWRKQGQVKMMDFLEVFI